MLLRNIFYIHKYIYIFFYSIRLTKSFIFLNIYTLTYRHLHITRDKYYKKMKKVEKIVTAFGICYQPA